MSNQSGLLYVVATPIGNLGDITHRAAAVLADVHLIAAEDTRHSRKLLTALGIKTPEMFAYHDHNENLAANKLLERLSKGENIALISDAGTPLLSDPGYRLVRMAQEAGFRVVPIPGASALTAALCVAGIATDKFIFEGFLSAKPSARVQRLQQLVTEQRSMVFYESSHRIEGSLLNMQQVFGDERIAVIARELTKTFETILRGSLAELVQQLAEQAVQRKGEFVVLVTGVSSEELDQSQELERVLRLLLPQLSVKHAANTAAEILAVPRNQAYKLALKLNAN